ncbi:epoxide hydrolase [Colletotrichum salicis]|uniref:Epoxide hydrolase n=1 Tax=Colletotrichum salicis TaxID=1209931 RepID=A0A135RUZ7_9PEZI|nr:epoxide hydrolase [Colletotrichum salicis]
MDVLATLDPRLQPDSGKSTGTVFLVHGWPDLALGWANHIPFLLSKGLSVVALDKIGYGGTDLSEDVKFYTWKRAADDIATLSSQLGLSRIILGGHDFGGAVVYRTAIWHPDLVAAFYVLNTPFAAPTASGKFKQPALYIAATQDLTLPPSLSEGMETYFDSLGRGEIDGGHWARWEKPLEVDKYVGNWLATSVFGNASLNLTAGLGLGAP